MVVTTAGSEEAMSAEREEHGDQIRRTDECGDAAREVIAGSMEHHGASLSEMLRRSGGSGSNSVGRFTSKAFASSSSCPSSYV